MNIKEILKRDDTVLVDGDPNATVILLDNPEVSTVVWLSKDIKFTQRVNPTVLRYASNYGFDTCDYDGQKCLVISKILADLKSDVVETVDPVEEPVLEEEPGPHLGFFMNAEPPEDEEE